MLKGTKSMNLSYSSIIDGKSVVYMTAAGSGNRKKQLHKDYSGSGDV